MHLAMSARGAEPPGQIGSTAIAGATKNTPTMTPATISTTMPPAARSNTLLIIVMTSESHMPLMRRRFPHQDRRQKNQKRGPWDLTSVVALYGEECARKCQTFRSKSRLLKE